MSSTFFGVSENLSEKKFSDVFEANLRKIFETFSANLFGDFIVHVEPNYDGLCVKFGQMRTHNY